MKTLVRELNVASGSDMISTDELATALLLAAFVNVMLS